MGRKVSSFEDFAKMVWGNRAEGIPVSGFDVQREISLAELEYLHLKFAFVQILNPASTDEFETIRFIRSRSGWIILNYKNAMCTSPGEMLFTDEIYTGLGHEVIRLNTGSGTRPKQIVDTAAEMVRMAKEEEHWPSIHIVNGEALMCWGIWKGARDLGIPVTGFVPTKRDEEKYKRIESHCPTLLMQSKPAVKP